MGFFLFFFFLSALKNLGLFVFIFREAAANGPSADLWLEYKYNASFLRCVYIITSDYTGVDMYTPPLFRSLRKPRPQLPPTRTDIQLLAKKELALS